MTISPFLVYGIKYLFHRHKGRFVLIPFLIAVAYSNFNVFTILMTWIIVFGLVFYFISGKLSNDNDLINDNDSSFEHISDPVFDVEYRFLDQNIYHDK